MSLTLNDYQNAALKTAKFPSIGDSDIGKILYPTLGLSGEAGEFAEKVKKALRDDNGTISEDKHALMVKELGDVMWYVAILANRLGVTLNEVAKINIDKLRDRNNRNVIGGSGDER